MEFHENEDEQEEMEAIPVTAGYESKMTIGSGEEGTSVTARRSCRYKECLKNHAIGLGGNAVDGCGEFLPAGEEGTLAALKCAACNCHRNFHRKEVEGEIFQHHGGVQAQYSSQHYRTPPSGYLHLTSQLGHHHRQLALPAASYGGGDGIEQEDLSNPSSSGGGSGGGIKKRYRTKFTREQKDRMLEFAEKLGWRIQKHDEDAVRQFCQEISIQRHVLKVWMHNNKHTLGKKP